MTVAIALHDLGEFAATHPNGRAVISGLGLRSVVLSFLKREEDDVKQQALLALSKIMVAKWQAAMA
jgi:V-type H+-transporting ATPase subunit H